MMDSGFNESDSLYLDNRKDELIAQDFVAAMKLKCFDEEFTYYATAYQDSQGIAYRVSRHRAALQKFVQTACVEGLYPTPVERYVRRLPCPSGYETKIRQQVKKEAAQKLRQYYTASYFRALAQLCHIEANNAAYPLLKQWQEALEGVYDQEKLALYEGLVLTAAESKVLTIKGYLEFKNWLGDVYKQLEDDILAKGQYKKVLSGFAYTKDGKQWLYDDDAKEEAAYEAKAAKTLQGYLTTPIFKRTIWLKNMNGFPAAKETFRQDYRAYCSGGYLERFLRIKSLPGVIDKAEFAAQEDYLQNHCGEKAQQVWASYRLKWNMKQPIYNGL